MLDTLIFRVHNLSNYPMLSNMVMTSTGKGTFSTTSDQKAVKQEVRKWMLDYGKGQAIPLRYSDKRKIPSSNHDITYTVDWGLDYLEVNVSVPKLLFGNNVCELVIPPGHKDFTVSNLSPYLHVDFIYNCIKEAVIKCVGYIAQGNYIQISMTDIEIFRIDLCINQHFTSKEEALRYLNHQKQINKKHNRINGASNLAEWKTSITFKTSRYYAKIYHKGTEFANVQKKHIRAIQKDREQKQHANSNVTALEYTAIKINELQDYADKILRYELEFTGKWLSILWNQHINKAWSDKWKAAVKIFNFFENNEEMREHIFKYVVRYVNLEGELVKEAPPVHNGVKLFFKKLNPITRKFELVPFSRKASERLLQLQQMNVRDDKTFKAWNKMMRSELNKSHKFLIRLDGNVVDTSLRYHTSPKTGNKIPIHASFPSSTEVRFTKSLISCCVDELKKFFDNFQIEGRRPMHELQDKLDSWNATRDMRIRNAISLKEKEIISKEKITDQMRRKLILFHTLSQKYSYRELVPKEYSKATYHRMKNLYTMVTDLRFNVGAAHFHESIQRDFNLIYGDLYREMQYGFIANYYNSILMPVGIQRMTSATGQKL
jgi:hypothetical protein